MKDLQAEAKAAIMQLDETEVEAILVLVTAYEDGATDEEAAEKAAAFFEAHNRPGQAQAVRDVAKELQKRAQE